MTGDLPSRRPEAHQATLAPTETDLDSSWASARGPLLPWILAGGWFLVAVVAWVRAEIVVSRLDKSGRLLEEEEGALRQRFEGFLDREAQGDQVERDQWEVIRSDRLLLGDKAPRDEVEDFGARLSRLEERIERLEGRLEARER